MNVYEINLEEHRDADGSLICVEVPKDIPFNIKRFFYINGVNSKSIRGEHACSNSKFAFLIIQGEAMLDLDDGVEKIVIKMEPRKVIIIDKNLWLKIYNCSSDSIILVFSDKTYLESDYIYDYEQFKRLAHRGR